MRTFYNRRFKSYTIIEFTPTKSLDKEETTDLLITSYQEDDDSNDFDKQFENFKLNEKLNSSKSNIYSFEN